MTWFGKILVMVNLALSLLLMTWAATLYTNRIDWSDQKGKDGHPDGELVRRKEEVAKLWDLVPPPAYAWKKTRDDLVVLEEGTPPDRKDGRLANRAWYQAEIQHLLTGATGGTNPARAVVFDANRRWAADDQNYGRPKMAAANDRMGNKLKSLAAYDQEEKAAFAGLKKEEDRLREAIELDTQLTDLLLGPKGLQQRLNFARVENEKAKSEHEQVKRPLISTYVEAAGLLQRKQELESRLEELKKARAARVAGLEQR